MSYVCQPESQHIDFKTRDDAKARFGFAYYDVEHPTTKGLAAARNPEGGMLMADLHRFWRGERTLQDDLVQRLKYAEAQNALLARMSPRMSQVVALSGDEPGAASSLGDRLESLGQRAAIGAALGAAVFAYVMPKEARVTGLAVGGMLGLLAAVGTAPPVK